jgi:uncharacterized protein YndB with AHSA1/START domain
MTTAESILERTVTIRAERDLVFRFFTDSAKWASWWGAGSTIEPRVGGKVRICYPGGVEAAGEVTEIVPPDRIRFTYGYVSGKPIGVGESRVTIRLSDVREGTRVQLSHHFTDAAVAREHVQGWRYQLSLFSNAVANERHARAADAVDGWFAMWSNPVDAERWQQLDRLAAAGIAVRDKFSALEGVEEVRAHIDGVHRFMPGVTLKRDGEVRHCQGEVLVNWISSGKDGKAMGAGANIFTLAPDGRIAAVTGFWS